ncbi:glycosyltransferase [Candidatus Bathyarchaeota archaeon]|nr:glycosyltransferase [Candidatus Bathyarchaeota archaeon]MBS7630240.1 glycosyltransferase [Candidatus Bathyarchaeota archaeon]
MLSNSCEIFLVGRCRGERRMMVQVLALLYFILSVLLLPYGYNCFLMVYGARIYKSKRLEPVKNHPKVTVQLPVYNEKLVISRLIRAVCALNWPKDRLEILVLDDSDDETSRIIDEEINVFKSQGFGIKVIRRRGRIGFKAGALQNALKYSNGKYIAIFDADFIPSSDFLERVIPYLEEDPRLGFVQTRLGHTNREFNKISEVIAIAIDGHFLVEQPGRDALSMAINFNGSGGVLRKDAIEDVGGWSTDVLTEDLEMSFKMRLKGWGSKYLRNVIVPGEVPISITAFKYQQARWAAGGVQCARKLLWRIWRSGFFNLKQKVEATIHLTNYFIYVFMFSSIFILIPLLLLGEIPYMMFNYPFGIFFSVGTFGASLMYTFSIILQKMDLKANISNISLLAAIGIGISAVCSFSILKGLLFKKKEFVTTPKYNINGRSVESFSVLYGQLRKMPVTEIAMALYSFFGLYLVIVNRIFNLIPTLIIYIIGFSTIIYFTLLHPRIVRLK